MPSIFLLSLVNRTTLMYIVACARDAVDSVHNAGA